MTRISAIIASFLATSAAIAAPDAREVTIYSAPGLHDGTGSWFEREFAAFTRETGIKVVYVQDGAGVIVDRAAKDRSQVDVIMTTPPFIQKAAGEGLLQAYTPSASTEISGGTLYYQPIARNYLTYIYNGAVLKDAPGAYLDLLDPKYKGKIQYSTPGQAGDGMSFLLQVFHSFGSKSAGFDYLKRLQVNNVGPSPVTGPLTALVNKGTLYVANGDLQMNLAQEADNPDIRIFWPTDPDGTRSTIAMPYYIGLGIEEPHGANGRALIDFLLSKQAQQTVGGEPVRRDVRRTDAEHARWTKTLQGVTVWEPDWGQVLRDLPADLARWHAVTGE